MDKNGFVIGCNKRSHYIVRKGRKNRSLVQYNLWNLVTVIKSLYAHETKLPPFIFFQGSSHRVGIFIQAEKESKATLASLKNVWTNWVLGRAWLKHFEKHTVNSIVSWSTIYKPMDNKLTDYEPITNGSIANRFTVTEPMVPKKHLPIMDDYSSQC